MALMRSSTLPLLFLGANGFPSKVYKPSISKILKNLNRPPLELTTAKITDKGYTSLFDYHQLLTSPRLLNWKSIIDEITNTAISLNTGNGVIGVGHSAGGAMLLACANLNPDLFHSLIVIDPPVFPPWKRYIFGALLKVLPISIINCSHPLIKGALKRRDVWEGGRLDFEAWMRKSSLFKKFDSESREAFANYYVRSLDMSAVTLQFPKRAEADIYLSTPMEVFGGEANGKFVGQYGRGFPNIGSTVCSHPRGIFFYSSTYQFIPEKDLHWLKSQDGFGRRQDGKEELGGCEFRSFTNGHFWPFEDNENFANRISCGIKVVCGEKNGTR